MRLESAAFGQNDVIPTDYTCDGLNISPPLHFVGVPEETVSLALIMNDPDAPDGDWVHWVVWNVPPQIGFLDEGVLPDSAHEGLTSFGRSGYGGPCPPTGLHHYFFQAYALDVTLDLSADADADALLAAMSGHILDKCGLVAVYAR